MNNSKSENPDWVETIISLANKEERDTEAPPLSKASLASNSHETINSS